MQIIPTEIRRVSTKALSISWSDGKKVEITSQLLRMKCPCASCLMKRGDMSHDTPLTPRKSSLKVIEHTLEQEISLERVWPIGNYALGFAWGDGHDTGIFSYQLLRELAEQTLAGN